ncbi:MAG: hypothetical protein KGZ83_10625 [Sulfuricella sp.]|nr:hypothetical protein [Sulfuricella sp.]
MNAEKVSVSLPAGLLLFVEQYRAEYGSKSRSQVIGEALELLRQRELEAAYREASRERDEGFHVALADGLSDEAW